MAAQVFGTSAVVLQLNQAFRGSAPSNAVFNNQREAVADMGDVAFANAFAADYVPAGADSAEDFVALSNTILGNLNLLPPTTAADKAAELQEALPQLLFAYQDSIGQVILNLTNIMRSLESDPNWGSAAALYNQQQAAALTFSSNPDNTGESTGGGDGGGGSLTLTVGQDGLTGSGAADTFTANVVQNSLGAQVNSLGSGDLLDGGAGVDTLMAKITAGVFAGGSWSMPIQPETESIEVVKLEAVWSDIEIANTPLDDVFVNAKDMTDVTQIWSYHSDADLVIQNMTTLDASGGIRNVSDLTVGYAYAGNSDTRWSESDYTVYFDQDYLNPEKTVSQPSIDLDVMNEDAYDETNAEQPLAGVYIAKLEFVLNGERYNLDQYIIEDRAGGGTEITTYDDLLAAIQAAILELQADNPDDAALQTLVAVKENTFLADISPITGLRREGETITLKVDGLTEGVENTLEVTATDLVLDPTEGAEIQNSNRFERAQATPPDVGQVLAINVALEKVGNAGDGGELIIGSMFKDSSNEWSSLYAGKGIDEFNVTVYGGSDKPSSLSGLHSTGNNLRVVTVATDSAQEDTYADLTIGNSNTDWDGEWGGYENALKDVQVFDASDFMGDLTLSAALTSEIADKYLDLEDVQGDPSADNMDFEYTGGAGNDDIELTVTADNWEASGAATREDFSLNIDGGEGNDHLTLAIIGGSDNDIDDQDELATDVAIGLSGAGYANWYDNQKLNDNLSIDGGAGDDTIWTPGSGDVTIDGGAGDDTVYADNTGDFASWAFNTLTDNSVHNDLDNLQSDANDRYQVYNGKLTVTYRGLEVTVALPHTNGYVTDLQVNQAIKNAINNDAVLSQLLWAHDGPANTLVVHAQIDTPWGKEGTTLAPTDLEIELSAPKSLTAAEVSQLSVYYGAPGSSAASLLALMGSSIDAFEANGDYDNSADQKISDGGDDDGWFSFHSSDNVITPGLGNDVIVLGTGANSNDTVVYEGFGNGNDTVINFETDDTNDEWTQTVTSDDENETFTVTFSDLELDPNAPGVTLEFNGSAPIDLTNLDTDGSVLRAIDIAYLVGEEGSIFDGTGEEWTVLWDEGTNQVEFTRVNPGNFDNDTGTDADDDIEAEDFVFSGTDADPGEVSISGYQDGGDAYAAAENAEFLVDLNGSAAVADDTFTFTYDDDQDVATVNDIEIDIDYLAGDGPITLANKLAAALNATGDWDATANDDGTVSAVRAVAGEFDIITYVYDLNTTEIADAEVNGLDIGLTPVSGGADQLGTIEVTVIASSDGLDYLDFSAYDAVAVIVDGVVVAGTSPTNGQEYVRMTESTTNDGVYTVAVYTEAGASDTLVGTIGVIDFGDYVDEFVSENFIL